jgi:hypothetical protein
MFPALVALKMQTYGIAADRKRPAVEFENPRGKAFQILESVTVMAARAWQFKGCSSALMLGFIL